MQTETSVDIFYVVRTLAAEGERNHYLCSVLYETGPQAQTELTRLQREDAAARYEVWKSATFVEPAEWRHRVVRADGSLIHTRLRGTTQDIET
jgi:hypothetical protein